MKLQRRVVLYVVAIAFVVTFYTILYQLGMSTVEGRERSFIESLHTVVQSLTTTGYGQDAPWNSRVMNVFTIVMQLTGIVLIFLLLPLFAVPWFRDLIHDRRAETIDPMQGHVVLSGHTPLVHTFIRELESHAHRHPHIIIEPEEDRISELIDLGHTVLQGDPESESTLRTASIQDADVAVIDGDDETVLNVTLAIRDVAADIRLVAIIEEDSVVPYLDYAGADYILQPRQVLGQALVGRFMITTQDDDQTEDILILGHGTVGSTVREALEQENVTVTVVDTDPGGKVDVTGDATDPSTLVEAGIETADLVVITLPDDRQAVHATLVAREHNPAAHICVRATDDRSTSRLKRAGADHVHSLPRIAGQMLTVTALDEAVTISDEHLTISRVTTSDEQLTEFTETTSTGVEDIIAVERNDDLFLAPDQDFELENGDILIMARNDH